MSEERGEQLNHGYLCQPFTSKGHFHLPSGIAPVIMDTSARHHLATRPDNSVLFLPHSWNINGKPITDRALEELTGKTKKGLHDEGESRYEEILSENLSEVLETAKQIADRNIERSKVLMEPLRLMNSGYYQGEELKEYEFRDDTQDYTAFIQRKFLQWHERGLAYFDNTADTPQFYLDIDKLYEQRPLAQISDGLSASKSAIRIFSNNYRNYTKDLPITAAGGYAIPVPIRVDNRGNLEPIDVSSDPVDPRTEGINQNHLLTIKPLIGCYVFIEYLADRFGDFDTVAISNDYHMATRVNFVSLLLGDKRYRNMRMIHFNLFLDEEGRVYSFKRGVVQDIDDLEKLGSGFARFTLVKNTKLGFSNNQVDFDIASFQKIQKILHESEGGDNFDDVVESKMLKRQVSISEFTARCVESGDISRAVNFLSDVLFQHPNNSVAKYYLNLFI